MRNRLAFVSSFLNVRSRVRKIEGAVYCVAITHVTAQFPSWLLGKTCTVAITHFTAYDGLLRTASCLGLHSPAGVSRSSCGLRGNPNSMSRSRSRAVRSSCGLRGIRRILRNEESSREASFTHYTAYSLSEKKRFRRSCPDAAESETGDARISSRMAPALHTPRGKGVRLPPTCETFLGSPARFAASRLPSACARNAARLIFSGAPGYSRPHAHETQYASSFQGFLGTPARTKRRAALDALKNPSAPSRHINGEVAAAALSS